MNALLITVDGETRTIRVIKSEAFLPRLTSIRWCRKLHSAVEFCITKANRLHNSLTFNAWLLCSFRFFRTHSCRRQWNKRLNIAHIKLNVMEVFLCESRRVTSLHRKEPLPQLPFWVLPLFTFSSLVCSERREDSAEIFSAFHIRFAHMQTCMALTSVLAIMCWWACTCTDIWRLEMRFAAHPSKAASSSFPEMSESTARDSSAMPMRAREVERSLNIL